MKKRPVAFFWIVMVMLLIMGTGCQTTVKPEGVLPRDSGQEEVTSEAGETQETIDVTAEPALIVTTSFFPYFDMIRQLGGPLVEVYQLVPDGADPHGYEPTPRDLIQLQSSHLFLYNGVDFENWGEAAVALLDETDTVVVRAGDLVDLISISENDDHGHDHDHDHGPEDPHLWTDPLNMIAIADHVMENIVSLDPGNEGIYRENHASYVADLQALDEAFRAVAREANHPYLLVSHSAFGYLAHRYGFVEISVAGVSPHAEPTPGRLAELTNLARQHQLEYIFFETLANPRTAEILASEAGLTPLMLYNAEGLTREQRDTDVTYISLMEENVQTLRKALVKQ